MIIKTKILLLLLFTFGLRNIIAKEEFINPSNYEFEKISIEQGLSQSTILSITQDNRGYLWFGTATGLNRYDGYEFLVYVNDVNDSTSLSDNEVSALYFDKKGILWIGTSNGILNKFDPKTETFSHIDIAGSSDWFSLENEENIPYPITFSRNHNSTITTISEDKDGNLWIGTWGKGIVKFDPSDNSRKYFYHFRGKENSLSSNKIVSLCIDSDGTIWAGTFGGGLNRLSTRNPGNNELKVESFNQKGVSLFGDKITSVFEDSNKNIWIGSYLGNAFYIKSDDRKLEVSKLKYTSLNIKSYEGAAKVSVMSITQDKNSNVWIATHGDGLYSYNLNQNVIYHFVNNVSDPKSLSGNEIQSLFVDRSGILWIGSQLGGGINKLSRKDKKFNSIPVLRDKGKSLNDNIIWAIHEDREKNIWFGTYRGGLNKWDTKANKFTYYDKKNGLPDNHIRTIVEDSISNLWIGTFSSGLCLFDRRSSSIKSLKSTDYFNSISGNQIQSLMLESDSILWVGVYGGGLIKFNILEFYKSGTIKQVTYMHDPIDNSSISDNRVYTIYKDSKNVFWIGTHGGGLNKYVDSLNSFISYQSFPNLPNTLTDNRILCMLEIPGYKFLVGTFGGGLNLFDPSENRFTSLQESIGLSCSDIYGILTDSLTGYWLSTNDGIFLLDSSLTSFRRFDLSDGLQSLEFSGGAYHKSKNGIFYFGGINGVNYFDPHGIKIDMYLPPIVISRIKIFDKAIRGEKDKLEFGKDQNYFSFEFASLDYKNSSRNKYKFMLEGLDKKWSYTDALDRRVFYTNLDPGKYIFRVQGTNNDGIWSPNEARVEITILGPFWTQWWFISLLIVFVGGIITFLIYQRIKYLVAMDKLKTNIAADLHDNVGAGLTEISILSELAYNDIKNPINASKHINHIGQLSRELVESMSDIVWVVNPHLDSLYDLIVRLKDNYADLLASLNIKLEASNLEKLDSIHLPMDYRQNLYLILKESINNSIKHSNCTLMEIKIILHRDGLQIYVIDDGNGFDIYKSNYGNGLRNIFTRGKNINGKVEINSKVGKGTTVKFEGKLKK